MKEFDDSKLDAGEEIEEKTIKYVVRYEKEIDAETGEEKLKPFYEDISGFKIKHIDTGQYQRLIENSVEVSSDSTKIKPKIAALNEAKMLACLHDCPLSITDPKTNQKIEWLKADNNKRVMRWRKLKPQVSQAILKAIDEVNGTSINFQ